MQITFGPRFLLCSIIFFFDKSALIKILIQILSMSKHSTYTSFVTEGNDHY